MHNAIKYVKQLETVGLTREQAEAHVEIMAEIMDTHLATKHDLKEGLKDLEAKFELRFHDVLNRIEQTEQKMTIKLGTIVSIAIGIAVGLSKVL